MTTTETQRQDTSRIRPTEARAFLEEVAAYHRKKARVFDQGHDNIIMRANEPANSAHNEIVKEMGTAGLATVLAKRADWHSNVARLVGELKKLIHG